MSNSEMIGLVFFGVLVVFGIFLYMPHSGSASLTNNPFGVLDTYSVDSNWSEEGLLEGLVTDEEILYAEANQEGNWTGIVQDEPDSRTIRLDAIGDPRDGQVVLYINAWEQLPNGDAPDHVFVQPLNDFEIEQNFMAEQYNYFNVKVEIIEESGSSNQRPYLDSFTVEFLNESDQFGMDSESFEIFTLIVFIGCALVAFTRFVD